MSPTKFSVEYQDITKRQYRLALSVLFLSGILHVVSPLLPHLATIVKYACTGQTDKITKVILVDINKAISSPKHVFPELTPTPLSEEETREILLGEYENFRKDHNVPSFGALDPKRQGKLDPNATWKTLFLRVYGIDTCMAKYFPKSLKAIDESGWTKQGCFATLVGPQGTQGSWSQFAGLAVSRVRTHEAGLAQGGR